MPREMTLGARSLGEGRTRFRVYARKRRQVEVALETPDGLQYLPLARQPDGSFEGVHPALPGMRYRYRLDGGEAFPDPASRFQPEGPHGPSEIIDPTAFRWTDGDWRGVPIEGQVLYELHVGTYTAEGTYAALQAKLPHLKELGVTVLELMPLHTCPGRFNWGYDGTTLFAPSPNYGRPDDLRRLVDAAHRLGLAVVVDVVYNHLGPDGNYLAQFADSYFSTRYKGEWGDPTNFDGEDAGPTRDLFLQNIAYWVREFHFDGVRIDATQSLFDASPRHILGELVQAVREAGEGRRTLVICESEPQDVRLVQPPSAGGYGADALWVDDFHHSARVALSGRAEAYVWDYRGTAQELLSCALRNSLFQGQYYHHQRKPRGGHLLRTPARHVVLYLQNHDQIANTLRGQRLHMTCGPKRMRALTCALLLFPQTPMLFMGQEFMASTPFLYFVDHKPELQARVEKGRSEFLSQFPSARHAIEQEGYRTPFGEDAFRRSTLDWADAERNREMLLLHKELLRLRREDPCFRAQDRSRLEGAVLSESAFVLRYLGETGDRLLIVNLGTSLDLFPCPEPLLAARPNRRWQLILSSEETRFGGMGGMAPTGEGPWYIPGQTALVLAEEEA